MEIPTKKKVEDFFSDYPLSRYNKGQTIMSPEEALTGAFYLKKGFVREYVISPFGGELTLHMFAPGSFFPMTWIISGIENRYHYETVTNVEIHKAPRDKILQFLKSSPEVLFDLTRRLLLGIDKLLLRIEYLGFEKAEFRIASILLYLSRHFAQEKGKQRILKTRFTHREVAALAAVTRETTSRVLDKLKKKNIITYDNRLLVIKDIERLASEVEHFQ